MESRAPAPATSGGAGRGWLFEEELQLDRADLDQVQVLQQDGLLHRMAVDPGFGHAAGAA